jgi:ABC-type polysaccharide/polyol phosphate transport system ATPase subunit
MFAIQLKNVTKIYNLYGSQKDQFIDLLGLERFGIKPKEKPKKFVALNNISLELKPGQRIGIIGRNGAGKTTLLKLICGNFVPTQGSIKVNGVEVFILSIQVVKTLNLPCSTTVLLTMNTKMHWMKLSIFASWVIFWISRLKLIH